MRLAAALDAAGDVVEIFTGVPRRAFSRALDVWDPRARSRLRTLVRTFVPDIVHVHNFLRELSPSILGASSVPAHVLTMHDVRLLGFADRTGSRRGGGPSAYAKRMAARLGRVQALRHIDVAIAPSSVLARLLEEAGFRTVYHVPHFADPGPEPERSPSASYDVAYAGRLSREKGVFQLIEAFAYVAPHHSASRLIFAGDGPERRPLERLAAQIAPGRVRFTGLLDERNVRRLMEGCRMVVAPSTVPEAAGLTVLEAALAGRPVIVSDDPALRELVDEARCGAIVGRGDISGLSRAIDSLLGDPDTCDAMGSAGRRVAVRTRSIDAGVGATKTAYEAAIRDRTHRRTSALPPAD